MVITVNNSGQLGNRLFLFAHHIVNALEYNYQLINLGFNDYAPYFVSTSENDFKGYPVSLHLHGKKLPKQTLPFFKYKFTYRLLEFYSNLQSKSKKWVIISDEGKDYDLNNPEFVKYATTSTLISHGWLFRNKQKFSTHSDSIRKIFTPLPGYTNNINTLIDECRNNCDILVGVHIRKGDYANFKEGIYFFTNETYLEKMNTIVNFFKGKKVGFLLCSNETVDMSVFQGLTTFIANGQFIEDIYSLAQCDCIIGPPSTYSKWSSFYGEVPLCSFTKDQQITPNDFELIYSTKPTIFSKISVSSASSL
ncbi:hypothetical protein GXP67_35830 [Rhodocytophaga rosea]|uniref:Alpha-1,2-fucosyltransferase n=1 Tax=Rhodocytophaga rosea TaxID=2704465 RepID=A0A6C0GTZ6_9BACT|nr:alpha-1,2-fucosyltransferase [Rhodocytophaga rosea]QHT71661.1 hypothetical protein GXP67_35830 [Rhodocytophaga rosea]